MEPGKRSINPRAARDTAALARVPRNASIRSAEPPDVQHGGDAEARSDAPRFVNRSLFLTP